MRTIILLSLAAALTNISSAATLPTVKTTVPPEITELNDCIQTRFLDRKSFGMSRIAPRPVIKPGTHSIRTFQPENPREQAVVDQLREKGIEVVAYLVGRQALAEPPVKAPRAELQGPASITLAPDSRLPDEAALFSEGKMALAEIGLEQGYDTRKGNWMVAVRPLRASDYGCIQCHTTTASPPKIGDALGVVMYAYRHRK